jgi:hypothetical protein
VVKIAVLHEYLWRSEPWWVPPVYGAPILLGYSLLTGRWALAFVVYVAFVIGVVGLLAGHSLTQRGRRP